MSDRHILHAIVMQSIWRDQFEDVEETQYAIPGLRAPVAIAFTREEIAEVATVLDDFGYDFNRETGEEFDSLNPGARRVVNAILDAAEALEKEDKE